MNGPLHSSVADWKGTVLSISTVWHRQLPWVLRAMAISIGMTGFTTSAKADDASFGCKVLLCAAASAPAWSGIPYCVPVMHQLFSDLGKGHPWPSCPEGGETSGINYDPYLPCPEGTVAGGTMMEGHDSTGGWTASSQGPECGKFVRPIGSHLNNSSDFEVVTTPRPRRDDPYNVVITPKGAFPITVWFSLNKD
jgi:hypothetical protein